MAHSYLISGARTPIGSFLGGLSSVSAPKLGGIAIEAAMSRAQVAADKVDEVIMGNVIGAGVGQAPARQAALAAGLPNSIAALTINKVCGSGLKAVMLADQAIRCGDASVIVAGGMENMSAAPHIVKNLRGGLKLGDGALVDAMVSDGLTCSFENCHMGMHAEHIANKFNVTREQQDEFSATSQQRAAAAVESGVLDSEIVPVTIKHRKGDKVVDKDECVRADSTAEGLGKLRPVFDREGSVTAGNASTLSDGAAAVVVASEEAAASSENTEKVNIWGGGISLGHPIGASGTRVLVTLMSALTHTEKKIGVASLCLGGGNAVAMVIERC